MRPRVWDWRADGSLAIHTGQPGFVVTTHTYIYRYISAHVLAQSCTLLPRVSTQYLSSQAAFTKDAKEEDLAAAAARRRERLARVGLARASLRNVIKANQGLCVRERVRVCERVSVSE